MEAVIRRVLDEMCVVEISRAIFRYLETFRCSGPHFVIVTFASCKQIVPWHIFTFFVLDAFDIRCTNKVSLLLSLVRVKGNK